MATFYGAAMAIMFVFFATQYGALALLAERRDGTLARLLAAPVAPAAIVLGGSLAGMVLGLVAMTTLVVATTVLVHASWGPPVLLAVLLIAAVIAATGDLDPGLDAGEDRRAGRRAERDRRPEHGRDRRRLHPAEPGAGAARHASP